MESDHFQVPAVVLPLTPGCGPAVTLKPDELSVAAHDAERGLLRAGFNDNTGRSYRADLRYWAAWFLLRYGQALSVPVAPTTVVQFIVDHAERPDEDGRLVHELPTELDAALVSAGFKRARGVPALSTLRHRLAVLSQAHRVRGLPSPCDDGRVRELLMRTHRAYAKRGALPHEHPALTREPLEALLSTCDGTLAGLRDRAVLLFAFSSGGRRRSELAAATIENTRRQSDGSYLFTLQLSKTNQDGASLPQNEKPLVGRAAQALTDWLAAARIREGAIFRRVRSGGVVAEALGAASIRYIVKQRCKLAGIDEPYTAHSLRSGFVTEAGRQGVAMGDAMAMTGHTSANSLLRYFRSDARQSPAARLMDEPPS